MGRVKVRWDRPLPTTAVVRTVTVRRVAERWYTCFSLAVNRSRAVATPGRPHVGLDLGIQHFATLSTGEQVPGPRAYRAAIRKLRLAQPRGGCRHKSDNIPQKMLTTLAPRHLRLC